VVNPSVADELMAVKWIGNAGVHSSPLTRDDVFDGYDLMDHVLRTLFDATPSHASRIARAVNARRRPRSARVAKRGSVDW
jgi:hypothetical protein